MVVKKNTTSPMNWDTVGPSSWAPDPAPSSASGSVRGPASAARPEMDGLLDGSKSPVGFFS